MRIALKGFEEDFERFVARKTAVEEEVKAEYEKVLAERTAKLDLLINETSEEVEDPEPEEAETEENAENEEAGE